MRPTPWIFLLGGLVAAAQPALAQQLISGMTGAQCAGRGGTIRTWTNTAGTYPAVGECWIPPRAGSSSRGSSSGSGYSGGGNTGRIGAAIGLLGAARSLLESIQQQRQEAARREEATQAALEADERGREAFTEGRFVDAVEEFELAASIWEELGETAVAEAALENARISQEKQDELEEEEEKRAAEQREAEERRRTEIAEAERRAAEARNQPASPPKTAFNCGPGPVPADVVGCWDLGGKQARTTAPPPKAPTLRERLREQIKSARQDAPKPADRPTR